jgi:hypothetical protein
LALTKPSGVNAPVVSPATFALARESGAPHPTGDAIKPTRAARATSPPDCMTEDVWVHGMRHAESGVGLTFGPALGGTNRRLFDAAFRAGRFQVFAGEMRSHHG